MLIVMSNCMCFYKKIVPFVPDLAFVPGFGVQVEYDFWLYWVLISWDTSRGHFCV